MRNVTTLLLLLSLAACSATSPAADETIGDNFEPGEDVTGADAGEFDTTEPGEDTSEPGEDTVEPSALTTPLPSTGQTHCFGEGPGIVCPAQGQAFSGQDAQYGGAPSYTDNGDGTITDNRTGLMWQQDPGEKMTYAEAVAGADSFSLAGHDDWRLPTIKELYSLIHFDGLDPSGCESEADCPDLVPFIDTDYFVFSYGDTSTERLIDSQFASSTVYVGTVFGGQEAMFGVNFADGRIKGYPTGEQPGGGAKGYFVLYVRDNPDYGTNDFVSEVSGTVTDYATGLMWEQADTPSLAWEDALAHCEALDSAGFDDWRLPDAKELQSIVDYSRSPSTTSSAAIDPIFEATPITDEGGSNNWAFYWTSTTHVNMGSGANAAYVAFGEALGFNESPPGSGKVELQDVHGAGAQRSDPKIGDPDDYPTGHGPQGDVIRIFNHVRCVRGGADFDATAGQTAWDPPGMTPNQGADACKDVNCDDLCPPDAPMGCTCIEGMMGEPVCLPACDTTDDCPTPPDKTLTCQNNLCLPVGGP